MSGTAEIFLRFHSQQVGQQERKTLPDYFLSVFPFDGTIHRRGSGYIRGTCGCSGETGGHYLCL